MRHFLPFLAALVPFAAHAADLTATARVTEATVFAQGAVLTWNVDVTGASGAGIVAVPLPPGATDYAGLRVTGGPGLEVLGVRVRAASADSAPEPKLRGNARTELRAAEAKERAVLAELDGTEAKIAAADARIAFLHRVRSDDTSVSPPPLDAIRAMADLVAEEVATAWDEKTDALTRKREIESDLVEIRAKVSRLKSIYAASEPDENAATVVIDVAKATDAPAALTLTYRVADASWSPAYELTLDRAAGKVVMVRSLRVQQSSGADWNDIRLFLSSARSYGRTEAGDLYPDLRSIAKPEPAAVPEDEEGMGGMAAPVMEEAPVTGLATLYPPTLIYYGDTVVYRYSRPISLATHAEFLTLPLDRLELPAKISAVAVPSRGETAYYSAAITNSSPEMLLPGPADLYRDGALVGQTQFAALAPGVDAKIGFGPIEALRLKRDDPRRNTGSRGVLTTSNEQEETAVIEVRNVGAEVWTVRLLDQVPYSEQEDLVATWEADPPPAEIDVDSQRGILAWELQVAPGEAKTVTLTSRLRWPEGMELR
jgi:uncharacterized protein (TIGR02231 family)